MTSHKVSVIIPVYNCQVYLCQCIDSILDQTFDEYELILIDDGSEDESGIICDEYGKNHSEIRVIHQKNGGLPAARKVGIDYAHGDYILFVDADDWVDSNHIQSLVTMAERAKADVVLCGFIIEYPQKKVKYINVPSSTMGKGIVLESLNNSLHAGVVFKLIRRAIFLEYDIKFPKYNYFEDMYLSTQILLHSNKIVSTGLTTYHYRYNQSSMTHCRNTDFRITKFKEFILNMQELFDILSLWNDEQTSNALYRRINREKLELLVLPFDDRKEISKAYDYYPDSWKEYQVGLNLFRVSNYIALRYRILMVAQLYMHLRVMVKELLKGAS